MAHQGLTSRNDHRSVWNTGTQVWLAFTPLPFTPIKSSHPKTSAQTFPFLMENLCISHRTPASCTPPWSCWQSCSPRVGPVVWTPHFHQTMPEPSSGAHQGLPQACTPLFVMGTWWCMLHHLRWLGKWICCSSPVMASRAEAKQRRNPPQTTAFTWKFPVSESMLLSCCHPKPPQIQTDQISTPH